MANAPPETKKHEKGTLAEHETFTLTAKDGVFSIVLEASTLVEVCPAQWDSKNKQCVLDGSAYASV